MATGSSSVVNFGDPLPQKELALAGQHARPELLTRGAGAQVRGPGVLVNQGETPYDEAVTLRVWTGIGDVIPLAVKRVKRALGEQSNRS
jgi:hypothetical protein